MQHQLCAIAWGLIAIYAAIGAVTAVRLWLLDRRTR